MFRKNQVVDVNDSRKRHPIENANIISKLLFCWLPPIVFTKFDTEKLAPPAAADDSVNISNALELEWKNSKPSFLKALLRTFGKKIALNGLLMITEEMLRIFEVLLLVRFMGFFDGAIDWQEASMYGALIVIILTICSLMRHPYFWNCSRYGLQIQTACSGLLYKKLLRLSQSTLSGSNIYNLLTNDIARLEQVATFLPYFIIAPLQVLFVIFYVSFRIHFSFLGGLLVLLIFIPIQVAIGFAMDNARVKASDYTDKRTGLITELIEGIKVIKMYAWENYFKKRITYLREKEIKYQTYINFIAAINSIVDLDFSIFIAFVSISFLLIFTNIELKSIHIIYAMGFYSRLCCTLGYFLSRAIKFTVYASISAKRIQEFLNLPENTSKHFTYDSVSDTDVTVKAENLSATHKTNTSQNIEDFELQNINFEASSKDLVVFSGAAGAGKTTLLLTLLGEIPTFIGNVKLNGRIFYIPKKPWIFNGTIKENILFGKEYDENKLKNIIKICCLEEDLKKLPHGIDQIVTDDGNDLSGGQKARINIARGVYQDAQIYLFNNPLSAIDPEYTVQIQKKCIYGYLRSKLRLLMVNDTVGWENANMIFSIKNGKMTCERRNSDVEESDESELKEDAEELLEELQVKTDDVKIKATDIKIKTENQTKNEYDESSISNKVYIKYVKSFTGYIGFIFVVLLFCVSQALTIFSDYWISTHTSDMFNQNITTSSNQNQLFASSQVYVIYSVTVAGSVFFIIFRALVYFLFSKRSSLKLHDDMLTSIISTDYYFFTKTSLGSLFNRFSRDMGFIDDTLPQTNFELLQIIVFVGATFILASYLNPIIIAPGLVLGALGLYFRKKFTEVTRLLKREEIKKRNPILSHVKSSISGVAIIRSAGQIDKYLNSYHNMTNEHIRHYFPFLAYQRWFALRLDFMVLIFIILFIVLSIILKEFKVSISNQDSSGNIGILISYLFQWTVNYQLLFRLSCESQNLMVHVERVCELIGLKPECDKSGLKASKKRNQIEPLDVSRMRNFFTNGYIEFKNVRFSYKENELVLKGLSFDIQAKHKIGIIGRTGAGKSTLLMALLRMGNVNGSILIDGIDTVSIDLKTLRSNITVIPQDPTLFSGTIRDNLNPLENIEDFKLWSVLRMVKLDKVISKMSDGLDTVIERGSEELSIGQKQLLCLARAILKDSKIYLIDEATANIDHETERLVQDTLKVHLKNKTVLTIAHRLHTIIDSNKIIAITDGILLPQNYAEPIHLLDDRDSVLSQYYKCLTKEQQQIIQDSLNN